MNIKITKILQKVLGPIIIIILAGAVYFAQKQLDSPNENEAPLNGLGNQCEFVNLRCHFTLDGQRASATFAEKPVTEESVTVLLHLPAEMEIQSVWIEGDNMYMGKIPVLPDQIRPGEWEGWFMLGSCSEPVMRWKMLVNIKGRTAPTLLYFTTS
ncbi:hypothetical protein [Alteromonas sp. H39]|uniref:hypothetical protein n=1 Tax=Alteromonas sp. H39 TaxID=3389876 RepID=UPI0039E08CE7